MSRGEGVGGKGGAHGGFIAQKDDSHIQRQIEGLLVIKILRN